MTSTAMEKMIEEKDLTAHCQEVRELMEGKPPFVTRHGVTIAVLVILTGMGVLFMTDGPACELAKGIVDRILQQLSVNVKIPPGL